MAKIETYKNLNLQRYRKSRRLKIKKMPPPAATGEDVHTINIQIAD